MNYQPLIIIGAARSGTNILRDTLSTLEDWHTWDCDEINLIWRHGNLSMNCDVMGTSNLSPKIARYIRKAFEQQHKISGCPIILEKTCANSLRLPFIEAVFPEARYIYVVRDGRDVALSSVKRWTSSVELYYLIKKLRYVPIMDIPVHGLSFIRNRVSQLLSSERRQPIWGPRFPEMREWARKRPLIEVCAKQWAVCVEESDKAFAEMLPEKCVKITYENLVANPSNAMEKILDWYYGTGQSIQLSQDALFSIHAGSVNSWKSKRDAFTDDALEIMSSALKKHGYELSF